MIFALRNKGVFVAPNFYAEDATIFSNNILTQNPLDAITTLFNGYWVVGQYLLIYIAWLINAIFFGDITSLPISISITSCLFLGLVASMPYLLFRRSLGSLLAGLLVIASSLIPMGSSSYFIIGTIANLKFIFLYIAFLLILYRNTVVNSKFKLYIIDFLLLICVLTNIIAIFLLPFTLYPYRKKIALIFKTKKPKKLKPGPLTISLFLVLVLSFLYTLTVYAKGIPSLPGYLDGPYKPEATLPIVQRATLHTWLYPITDMFRNRLTVCLLFLVVSSAWIYRKKDRTIILFSLWSIVISTGLFVMNRTGVSDYYLNYGHKGGTDQFFYTQNLIFMFITVWLIREWFNKKTTLTKGFISFGFIIFMIWAIPYGNSQQRANVIYGELGTFKNDVDKACHLDQRDSDVHVQIYPSLDWDWDIARTKVCNNQ